MQLPIWGRASACSFNHELRSTPGAPSENASVLKHVSARQWLECQITACPVPSYDFSLADRERADHETSEDDSRARHGGPLS